MVGLLLVPVGVVCGFVGAYLMNGEAHHNYGEGIPALALGSGAVIAGLVSLSWGVWKRRREGTWRGRKHDLSRPGAPKHR
jgi:hypothetical protein